MKLNIVRFSLVLSCVFRIRQQSLHTLVEPEGPKGRPDFIVGVFVACTRNS